MSLTTFKQTDPGTEGLKLFLNGSNQVIAMTISTTGCDNVNYGDSLSALESVTINGVEILITSISNQTTHYAYDTTPTTITPTADNIVADSCMPVIFNPFLQEQNFTYNDYNATLGNSVELRRYNQVYEVDYTSFVSGAVVPSNLNAILNDSAVLAEVQESNYSSVGIANSHYNGAKTTEQSYGVTPAISAGIFNGSIYQISKSDQLICSSSISDRKIEEYLFAPDTRYTPGFTDAATTDALEVPGVREKILVKKQLGYTYTTTSTNSLTLPGTYDIIVGDVLKITTLPTTYEYILITSSTYNSGTNQTTITFTHNAYSSFGISSTISISSSQALTLYNMLGDTIYSAKGGQIYKIQEKKIWVQEIDGILITSPLGKVSIITTTCTT